MNLAPFATLDQVDKYLSQAISKAFPESSLPVSCRPTVRLDYGDVESDILLRLSKQLHTAPIILFEKLASSLVNLQTAFSFVNLSANAIR